jgi:hypothetical protein
VPPQIEVGLDAEKRLAEGNENRHRQNRIWVEVADANPIVITQFTKKGMAQIPKSMPVEILKHNYFARVGVWIALTVRASPRSPPCSSTCTILPPSVVLLLHGSRVPSFFPSSVVECGCGERGGVGAARSSGDWI